MAMLRIHLRDIFPACTCKRVGGDRPTTSWSHGPTCAAFLTSQIISQLGLRGLMDLARERTHSSVWIATRIRP